MPWLNVYFTTIKLKNILSNLKSAVPSSHRPSIVYKLTCPSCSGTFIGQAKDNETSTWKTQPTVARPLKEIILEAGAEQKKEQNEDLRRRKNVVIYRAPESKATNSKDRYDQDLEIVNQLCGSIDIDFTTVKQCTRLGRKPDDQSEQQTRPSLVTFDTINNADLMLKNLTKLKFANEKNLRQLRVTPDRSLKERENVRFLVQRAKN